MTLLDATATMIDACKTWAPENDKVLQRAVKRMEKRLAVLRLRAAKALRRRRQKGWADLQHLAPSCPSCGIEFSFGDFVKAAELNHRGDILNFDCPDCSERVVLLLVDGKCSSYIVAYDRALITVHSQSENRA